MSTDFKNRLLLISTIVVIFMTTIGGYYLINLKQGPYPASKFISLTYKWGLGDTLVNSYNSATGEYQYLNHKDSLVKTKVQLHANNIIFLHSRANELDFWKLPELIANKNADLNNKDILHYEMVFNYQGKSKKISFYTNYTDDMAIATAAQALQKLVEQTIDEAEERYSNQ